MSAKPRLMGLMAIVALSVLTMGCAAEWEDAYRGRSLALIIVEEWELPVEESATAFSETVEKDSKSFGKGGMLVLGTKAKDHLHGGYRENDTR